jgi:type I restriction enzyme S subunit
MKEGWKIRKIGEVCDLKTGGTPPTSKTEYFGGDVKWLVSGDIHQGEIFDCEGRITEAGMQASNAKQLPLNSVLIALNGQGKTRGTVALLRTQATCNQSLVSIYPKEPSSLLPEFLYANLHGRYQEIRQMTGDSGNDRRGLNMGLIRRMEIPLAPVDEQQRIVGILDQAFEGITTAKANAEKNLQNARALFASHLHSVFTVMGVKWVKRPLGEVCDLLNGFAFKSGAAVEESSTQVVRMGNLYGNRLDLDRSPVFYPDSFASAYKRYRLNEGDLIMSLTGTTGKEDYGYVVRVPECGHTLLMNQRIAKFDSLRESLVDRHFLFYYLRSRAFLDILYPTANGTRQANLSTVTIKSLPIPLCPVEKQRAIAVSLDGVNREAQRLEFIYQQKLTTLETLKKSLLNQAFTGNL